MHTWMILAVVSTAMMSAGFQTSATRAQTSNAAGDARVRLDLYRQFLFAAAQYMATNPSSGLPRQVTWEEIRSAPGTPPGLARAGIPAGWRLQVGADGSWVACTELPEASVTAIGQWSPVSQAVAGFPVVGAGSAAEASASAQQCEL